MKKILYTLMLLSASFSFVACGGKDNDDEPEFPEQEEQQQDQPSNPMAGKTIRCQKSTTSGSTKITTDFTIVFNSATRYTQTLKQTVQEQSWSTGQWTTTYALDNTLTGNYTYNTTAITLRADDGTASTLTKTADGWKDGNYTYK